MTKKTTAAKEHCQTYVVFDNEDLFEDGLKRIQPNLYVDQHTVYYNFI